MNGHAPSETRTNSGALVVICECGWRSAPRGCTTFDDKGKRVSAYKIVVDELLREHGRHALQSRGDGRTE